MPERSFPHETERIPVEILQIQEFDSTQIQTQNSRMLSAHVFHIGTVKGILR